MEFLASLLVAGISMGAVYALIALGLNLTFWTTRTLNFGQGSLMMLCAMLTAVLTAPGASPVLPILAGLAVVGLVAVLTERYAVRIGAQASGSMGWVVSTLGVGVLIQGVAAKYFGSQAIAFPDLVYSAQDTLMIGGVPVSLQYLVVLGLSILLIVGLELFLRRTIWGKCVRAVAMDWEAAAVAGVPVRSVIVYSFLGSGLLAGVAGLLTAQIGGTVDPAFGIDLMVFAFVAAVLGGMGSSIGALVGGIVIGLFEKLVGGYLSTSAEHGVVFALLILVLTLRPQGLLGRKEAVKA